MKVAFLNRMPGLLGGDHISTTYKIQALRKIGIEADLVWQDIAHRLEKFDLAHIIHLDFEFCRQNFAAVYEVGIPYVITPIHYPEINELSYEEKREALEGARAVIPFSKREGEELRATFGVDYIAVPNGTDPKFHAQPSSEREGVCTSDWGNTKKSHILNAACAELGIPFTRFSKVAHENMPQAYRKNKVYASASTSDRMSLSIGEALCSGCRVISSSANRGNEWYPGLSVMDCEASVADWVRKIEEVYNAPEWDWAPNDAARQITWEWRTEQMVEIYRSVLA